MSKIWFILLIIFFFLQQQVFAHSQVQIIEMTQDGFVPATTIVDTDSTIIFINKDSEPRWPASNVHPTHDLYSEFDSRLPIKPGDSWPFKPKKIGQWKYHDHLLPHLRATITVVAEQNPQSTQTKQSEKNSLFETIKIEFEEIFSKIKIFLTSLYKTEEKFTLLPASQFKKLSFDEQMKELKNIAQRNASKSWEYIKTVYKGQGGSEGNIHDLAHFAGMLLFETNGFEGIKSCSSEFAFGCYHGFLDKAFAKNLDKIEEAEISCKKLAPALTGPVASCIHGIGHGIASYYATKDIKKSLSSCRRLVSGNEYCYDGVFMEFVRSAPDSFFNKEDPLYPCNMLENEFGYAYSFACGRNQPSLLMGRFKTGFNEVVSICLSSDSKPFKEACFDSLGFSISSTGNVEQIITSCHVIGISEYISQCIKAAAGELVFQEVPGWFEKSKAVCNESPDSNSCQNHVDRIISEYNRTIKLNYSPIQKGEHVQSYLRGVLKKCYDIGGRGGCYKEAADVLYRQFGLKQTLAVLKENEGYPEVYARCHEVTHYLSRNEYKKQKNIAKVYAQCDSTCHGGCYHGTLEAHLQTEINNNIGNLVSVFSTVCGKPDEYQKPIEFNECLHGMGHAAMFVTDMELKESLTLCDTFSKEEQKERCLTGVFMENSSSSTSFDHQSKYIKQDDPFYPCNSLDEKYQSVCWQYQSSYFSILSHQDWKKVSDLCIQIPEKYQNRCFRTVGTNQVGHTSSLLTMKQNCDLMPAETFRDTCIAGVVSSLSYRFVGETEKMIEFCMLTNLNNRETCFKQIGSGALDWNRNKDLAKNECQKIPDPQGILWCMSVI